MRAAKPIRESSTGDGRGVTGNVVSRLKERIQQAQAMGFQVRMELLEDEQATWCEIGGTKTLFVDLSQTAAEQLHQIDSALTQYAAEQADPASTPTATAAGPPPAERRASGHNPTNRAA